MPRLQQLRYLVAVADTLNFSQAATLCGVTQPTLSMQLKELETRLGVRLVERTRARVILTPVGDAAVTRARTILAEVEHIREIARQDSSETPQGRLDMGVVQSVGAYVLSLAMPDLRRDYPSLRLHVREDRPAALAARLSDGTLDLLLLPDPPVRPEFYARHLLQEPLHLVLPADHRLARHAAIDPADLAGETILAMDTTAPLHDQIAGLCARFGARHTGDYAGTSLDTLRQMVASGMGVALLPALYVRSDVLREKLVVARPLSRGAPLRQITLVWRRSSPRHDVYLRLADSIASCLGPWDGAAGRPPGMAARHPRGG